MQNEGCSRVGMQLFIQFGIHAYDSYLKYFTIESNSSNLDVDTLLWGPAMLSTKGIEVLSV
jgi:hypothetical protein